MKDPGDLALVGTMLANADLFVQNLAPGATDRLGLGSARLREQFPRLIVCDLAASHLARPTVTVRLMIFWYRPKLDSPVSLSHVRP
ncbi:CoA transferase [Bradyrhizobium sp. SSUT77]|nr:CoA transferase [Bradyrhizobium sp. SSUT77]MDH2344200.1 CoA transferase [Bradyrhizobium sp. SSUT77]